MQSRRPGKEARTGHCNCSGKKYKLGESPNVECLIRVVAAPVRHLNYILMGKRQVDKDCPIKIPDGFALSANTHSFNVSLATAIGLTEAIILQNFLHWHNANKENESMKRNGRIWFFRSISGICECYPYLSPDKIRYAIDRLVKSGLLLKDNFSKDKMKKTNWYSITDKTLRLFGEGENSQMDAYNTEPFGKIPNDSVNSQLNYSKETIDKENYSIPYISLPSCQRDTGESADKVKKNHDDYSLDDKDNSDKEKHTKESWRESFDEYMKLVNEGAAALKADAKFRAEVEQLQPNVDYDRTIDNCVLKYWGTETGWDKKRKSRTKKIDMKMTLRNSFDMNKIPKDRYSRPQPKKNESRDIDY